MVAVSTAAPAGASAPAAGEGDDRDVDQTVEHDVEREPDAGRGPRLSTVVGAGFALWGLVIGLAPLHDNSFLTHLATGRLVLDTGRVPRTDPYTFTAHGQAWTAACWLAAVAYAAAERVAGLDGIRLFNAAVAVAVAVLVWRLTAPARSIVPRIAIAGIVSVVGIGMWVGRPLLVGLLCFAVVLTIVEGRADLRWLVPVMWIWVNAHGSFPLAPVLLGVLAIGTRLDGGRPDRELRALGWTVLGTALGAINPIGPSLLAYPVLLVQRTEAFAAIQEWQPPRFENPWQIAFVLQLIVAVALAVRVRRWRTVLPLLVFAALALTSARNIVVASLVLVPGMAAGAAGIGSISGDSRVRFGRPALAALAAIALLYTASALQGPDTQLQAYPEAGVSWLEAHDLLDHRVVAPDYVGNYLEARYHGEVQVFVDDRVDMFPLPLVADSLTLVRDEPGAEAVLDRYRAGVVLWPKDKPLSDTLKRSEAWRVAWQDEKWIVFLPA